MNTLTFTDLIDTNSLQMIQDSFAEYTGIAICVVDPEGNPVTKGSGGTEFCDQIVKCSKTGAARCAECDAYGKEKAREENRAVFYTCHAGMTDFVIPIVFGGRVIGTILAGQTRTEEIDEEKFRQKAQELGVDPDKYVEAASKNTYMSKEQAEKTTQFLSQFARALSVLAISNYNELKKSQKMENIARSQTSFIISLTEDLRASMKGWIDDFRTTTEKYRDIPEITCETDPLLAKGQEVYGVIDGVVDYIRLSGGKAEYSENVYEIRPLMENTAESLADIAKSAGVGVSMEYDPSLPQTFVGNSGRIGQILNKLTTNMIHFTNEGGSVRMVVSCERRGYASDLKIRFVNVGARTTAEMAESVRQYIGSGNADIFKNNEEVKGLDFPLIIYLVSQISGKIVLNSIDNGVIELTLSIPQLDGEKKEA